MKFVSATKAQQTGEELRRAAGAGTHPVPRAWQGEACKVFDDEMTLHTGRRNDKAQVLFRKVERAKDRIEDIHWDARTPSAVETKEVQKLQSLVNEGEAWLHRYVYLNPTIKERMYPVVNNRSINITDDIAAYLQEMNAAVGADAGLLRFHERVYLNVPFSDEDEAKTLGARRDSEEQLWYVPAGVGIDTARFEKWAR